MRYEVIVLPRAELQLYNSALWWAEHRDADQAIRWVEGMEAAIAALADNPQQHPVAREDALAEFTVRQIVCGLSRKPTHRAVFRVRDDKVFVYAVRHLHQRDLTPEELK